MAQAILVIKLGALGDFIQALGAMKAIRDHHKDDRITLMTTSPFAEMARSCGYFDDIFIDEKPKWTQPAKWFALRNKLCKMKIDRVYDLQNNDRSNIYFRLFNPARRPEWVGTACGASHRNNSPERTKSHAFEGHVQTLALAGIDNVTIDNLEWMKTDISRFGLAKPYVLLVPGCAPQHPQKRWPAGNYAALAVTLEKNGIQPVVLGTDAEQDVAETIVLSCPQARSLIGQTSLQDIATLAHGASGAVGNDTGPMHLIAATGCHSLALFSDYSNSKKHGPRGDNVSILQISDLRDLKPEEVWDNFRGLLRTSPKTGKARLSPRETN